MIMFIDKHRTSYGVGSICKVGSVAKILMLIAFLVRFLHTHVSFRPTGECTMISLALLRFVE